MALVIRELQAAGLTLRGIAKTLDDRGIPASISGTWTAVQVSRVLAQLDPGIWVAVER